MLIATLAGIGVRIAAAILLDTLALVVWDVGTRSPRRVFVEMRAALG